jgi:hypothetical protein
MATYSFFYNCPSVDDFLLCHETKQIRLAKQFMVYLKTLSYTDESNEVRLIMMMHEVGSILGSGSFMLDQLEAVDVEVIVLQFCSSSSLFIAPLCFTLLHSASLCFTLLHSASLCFTLLPSSLFFSLLHSPSSLFPLQSATFTLPCSLFFTLPPSLCSPLPHSSPSLSFTLLPPSLCFILHPHNPTSLT